MFAPTTGKLSRVTNAISSSDLASAPAYTTGAAALGANASTTVCVAGTVRAEVQMAGKKWANESGVESNCS